MCSFLKILGENLSALSSCGGCPRSLVHCSPLSASPGSAISYLYNLSSFVKSYTSVSDYNWESFFILRILTDSIGLIWITQATLHFTIFNFIISAKSPLTSARMESQVPGWGCGPFGRGIFLPITVARWKTFRLNNKRIMFNFVENISEEWWRKKAD